MAKVKNSEDVYIREHIQGQRHGAEAIIDLANAAGDDLPTEPAVESGADPTTVAIVDHGRWIATCGLATADGPCRNAQLVDPTDGRLICLDCRNAAIAGRWQAVEFPADVAAVEAALEDLPTSQQNWSP